MSFRYSDMRKSVYLIRCLPANAVYVGASRVVGRRLTAHRQALRKGEHSNSFMQQLYNDYGEDAFTFSPAVIVEDESDLAVYEQSVYCMLSRHGFTMINRGENTSKPMSGVSRPDMQTHEVIAHLNRWRYKALRKSAETRAANKEHYANIARKTLRRTLSTPGVEDRRKQNAASAVRRPEVRAKVSESLKKYYAENKHWAVGTTPDGERCRHKPTGTEFNSISQAARWAGVGVPTMHRWLKGRDGDHTKNRNYDWELIK